jgi:hypothetical protein
MAIPGVAAPRRKPQMKFIGVPRPAMVKFTVTLFTLSAPEPVWCSEGGDALHIPSFSVVSLSKHGYFRPYRNKMLVPSFKLIRK